MNTSPSPNREVDRLAANQSKEFREEVDHVFQSYADVRAELERVSVLRRAETFEKHLKELRKQLQALLRESCDI